MLEIEDNLVDNFILVSEVKVSTFEERISKNIQGVESISSITMIRNKMDEYLLGDISFNDLVDYTVDKYSDGVKVLEDVNYAVRYTDGQVVTRYPNNKEVKSSANMSDFSDEITAMIMRKDGTYFLQVISPIVFQGEVIGHDQVEFRLD